MPEFLTILLVVDVEKPAVMLRRFFSALAHFNGQVLYDIQVITLDQGQDCGTIHSAAADAGVPILMLGANDQRAPNGYPIWDVLAETRFAWPFIRGQYVTWAHPEFVYAPGALERTLAWLQRETPDLGLGNLRRFGEADMVRLPATARGNPVLSGRLADALDAGDWTLAAGLAEQLPTCRWVHWIPEPVPGETRWLEDAVFVRREWIETARFLHHGGILPFQDVYDLFGAFCRECTLYAGLVKTRQRLLEAPAIAPACVRMPLDVGRILHLHHEIAWGSWTEPVRDWFLSRPEWRNTPFGNEVAWRHALERPALAYRIFRQGPHGTIRRYGAAVREWLVRGGFGALLSYYAGRRQPEEAAAC